jgi:hypothetical protein
MSKNPKAGRAIRKLKKAKTSGEALKIIQKLDPKTKKKVQE